MVKCPHAASGCDYPASECAGHCASKQQPEALRLADGLDTPDEDGFVTQLDQDAAAELRRLHAENAEQIGEIVALKEQRDELRNSVKRLHAAKGRHHTQHAICDLFDLVGLKNERPTK